MKCGLSVPAETYEIFSFQRSMIEEIHFLALSDDWILFIDSKLIIYKSLISIITVSIAALCDK